MTTSRRNFLRNTATTGIAAATLAAFPPSIRRALAIPANNKTGTINDVEHVVILMQENRSFDHYFGTMRGVRGFGDRFTIPLPNGRTVWEQEYRAGQIVSPYYLDSSQGNALRVKGTPHDWSDGQDAWDGGRLSKWPLYKETSKAPFTQSMGYYKEAELPFQFALANAFTLCDAYHCAMHTGTNSNRTFLWTGTNGPTAANVAMVTNEWDDIGPSTSGYDWTTYPERLEKAGVSWIVYQNMPSNYTDNSLCGFKQYRRANEASGKPVSHDGNVVSPAYDPASDNVGNPLYKGIANTMPDGGFLGTFKQDVLNRKLPNVSWIVAPSTYSEHPSPSSPVQGAWYTQEVLDALTAVPEVWSKTVLIVNFDENDGFFDHLPSPAAPSLNADGTPAGKTTLTEAEVAFERFTHPHPPGTTEQDTPDGRVYGPGMRVPMYVVSPWSRGGWVNSQAFDHTSVVRFLEARFNVMEPNISPFRRAVCGDLTSAFNFATPNTEVLPKLAGRTTKVDADTLRATQDALTQIALPGTVVRPTQTTGTRPSRALPYELHTSARVDTTRGTVQLLFSNTGRQAAVFHVYDKLHLNRLPRRYMVEAGKALDDTWNAATDNGSYDLWVLGPNGFHRHFKGDLNMLRAGDAPVPEVRVCYDITNGNVYLSMTNTGKNAAKFSIRAKAYREDGPWVSTVAGGATAEQHWELAGSGRWYDFEVTCDADVNYYRRFAGRVETGEPSVSDPAMGLTAL
ncbi:phosphocholine-specific phospholipase C [Variovorax arabinosiphilus]|uniref:phosphocholine-specific phospholipase C n=1 Tax=Variovorax arabinosiphilus TaxID=3053498 RepID=UPI002577E018|nr:MULTISPECIES: phospholipase C, phosphocholine-specific [unclassified Variovorax]MDM0123356.1 phospholipase C, phosphocholine-specific [Variovorax sp. J2L1-78]MDM0132415.1 phospholipase C, phosphocholine-specific [Variovorax sp. J2L1-63]MDM0231052.1 phospholipase C, phosphocholine-specific [Variovorax sp. J2R1-6]